MPIYLSESVADPEIVRENFKKIKSVLDTSITDIFPGTGINIDKTDPQNPIINAVSNTSGKYVISGGAVWSGSGLTYDVSVIKYYWNGNKATLQTSVTLAASDPTNNRLDAIVVDETENVSVITGEASSSPITPAIPDDKLLVQFILVEAGTTVPNVTQENIYLNNAEWTFANYTTSGTQVGSSNPDATDSPKEGTKCIDNSLDPRTGIRFSRATSLDITPYTTFEIWIRFPAVIDSRESLYAQFENTSFGPIGNQVNLFSYGINRNTTGTWQLAVVPVSAFGVSTVQGFRLILTGGKNGVQVAWDVDFITITDGSQPVTVSPEINFYKDSVKVASQKGLDIVAGTGMGITAAEDPAKETVKYTFTPDTNKAYVDAADSVLQGNIDAKENAITPGTTGQYWRGDKTWQAFDSAVLASLLSGLSVTGGAVTASDNVLSAFGKLQNQINGILGGATYQGVWNASTNTPALASGTGTKGYYVVSVDGSTNLDGITDWKVGDWAIFNGTTWDKVDNTDAVSSVNGAIGAISLAGTANRITVSGTTFDISSTYAGQTSINTLGTVTTGTWNAGAIGPTYGGTGITSYTTGDILYASATNVLSKLSVGANPDGYVLTLASGLPTWAAAGGGGGGGAISALTAASAGNTIDNLNYAQEWQWSTITSAPGLKISSSPATSRSLPLGFNLFNVALSGPVAGSQHVYAAMFSNTTTNPGWNSAAYFKASGGTNGNLGVYTDPNGIGIRRYNDPEYTFPGLHIYCGSDNQNYVDTSNQDLIFRTKWVGPTETMRLKNNGQVTFAAFPLDAGGARPVSGTNLIFTVCGGYGGFGFSSDNYVKFSAVYGGFSFYNNVTTGYESLRIWRTTGNVHIENGGTYTEITSSRFTVNSTTQGMLSPRMTLAQWGAISTPAEGLEGWNTTDHGKMWYDGTRSIGFRYNGTKFQGYDGSAWVDLN